MNWMTAQDLIKNKPYLAWYVKNPGELSDASVVEHILNYGDWDDVQKLIKILGVRKTAEIFRENAFRKRTNYKKSIIRYFSLYFEKHAKTS